MKSWIKFIKSRLFFLSSFSFHYLFMFKHQSPFRKPNIFLQGLTVCHTQFWFWFSHASLPSRGPGNMAWASSSVLGPSRGWRRSKKKLCSWVQGEAASAVKWALNLSSDCQEPRSGSVLGRLVAAGGPLKSAEEFLLNLHDFVCLQR